MAGSGLWVVHCTSLANLHVVSVSARRARRTSSGQSGRARQLHASPLLSSSHLFSSHRFLLSSLVWLIDQPSTHIPRLITNEIVKIRPFQTYVFYTDSIYMAISFVTLCDDCSRLQIWHSVNLVLLWKPGVRRCISKFEIWSSVEKVW